MTWIHEHWQRIAALTVVGVTVLLFLRRVLRKRTGSCGGDCECPAREFTTKADS